MFGTVAHIRVKPGHEQQVMELSREWADTRGRGVEGYVTGYLVRSERGPQEGILIAIFQDRESYMANAEDPEQDRWFRRFREHLQGDPDWHDGEFAEIR